MHSYRITLSRWSLKLTASGNPGRWNSAGQKMIYTAASRALACLENMAHRADEGQTNIYKVMVIEIPSELNIEKITLVDLPENWFLYEHFETCAAIGDQWLKKNISVVLRVPSAIILNEFNFLINPEHRDFKKIKLIRIEDFRFDPRIVTN